MIKQLVLIRDNHGFSNSCVCQCENTEIPAPERFCTLLRLPMDTELKNSENCIQTCAGPRFLLQNHTVLETSASSNGLGLASKPCFFKVRAILLDVWSMVENVHIYFSFEELGIDHQSAIARRYSVKNRAQNVPKTHRTSTTNRQLLEGTA